MRTALTKHASPTRSHRPRAITVFAAAFVAGAAAAVGVNRTLDVRLAQSKPRVESEALFVALRSLPQGSPVTVWDVALRDWPKAMMPASALRASDTFSGHVLKHPLREGQPLLSIQLLPAGQGTQPPSDSMPFPPPNAYTQSATPVTPVAEVDLWAPAEPVLAASIPSAPTATAPAVPQAAIPTTESPVAASQAAVVPTEASEPRQSASPETVSVQEVIPSETAPQAEAEQQPPSAQAITVSEPAPMEPTTAVTAADNSIADNVGTTDGTVITDSDVIAVPEDLVADASTTTAAPALERVAEPDPAPAPSQLPRPIRARYLVVPESIALQADASFVTGADAPQQTATPASTPVPQAALRSAADTVRPLPSTTATSRGPQNGRPQATTPQGRQPQRQGRQASPANSRTPAATQPRPRFGAAVFPNLSAGIETIEGQIRPDSAGQVETPATTPGRPVTAR